MTENTKKLFDAPWQIWGDGCQVCDIRGIERADCNDPDDSARITRLPELYDALVEVAYERCQLCIYKNSESARKMPSPNDMATNGGAPFCFQNCPCLKHWKLLKKVREGK